jgi:hypothetical protein
MADRIVHRFNSPFKMLGLPEPPPLPNAEDLSEIADKIGGIVDQAKKLPQTVITKFGEADEDYRNAQRSFGKKPRH